MKKSCIASFFFILICLFLLGSCGKESPVKASNRQGHLDELTFRSAALAANTTGESADKTIYVMLPPNYDSTNERYPVVYYLHGHGGDSSEMLTFEDALFKVMEGEAARFILVGVDGNTSLGGSFYVNSPYTGAWEDHLIKELVPLIDERYRTLAAAPSRGLMGFSMGGSGVLNLGLRHPDVFGAVWALCPGVLVPKKGLAEAMVSWKSFGGTFLESYALAFSKEKKIPLLDGSPEDNAVAAEWEKGFGDWEAKIGAYKQKGVDLKNIRIVYGELDIFSWIIEGSQYLAALLKEQGLPAELQGYAISHTIRPGTVTGDALPFFARTLVRQ